MKSLWPWILVGICILLAAWCNINTYFININTERIEKLENQLPVVHQVDTIYVINLQQNQKKKK